MAADQARCIFCAFSAMSRLSVLIPERSPPVWRRFSSSVPWRVDIPQRNSCGPAPVKGKVKGTRSNSSSTSATPGYTNLLNLTPTYTISRSIAPPAKPRNGNDNNGWVISPLYAPTETFMAIPPLPKGRRRRQRPKRNGPLPWSQIPRTLTHHPQEKSPYGVGNRYRGVFINNLAPGTTHADVTAGIAATAPVGPITSVKLLLRRRPGPADDAKRALGRLSAHVVFGRYQATAKLVEAAQKGVFRIRGAVVAQVSIDRSVAYHWNSGRRIDSRVLLVRGKAGMPGFTEAALRAAMDADGESMEAAGLLGARSEPVVSYEVDDAGCVTMEWRFFSHVQAMAMRTAVERAYGERLEVYMGWDPCWVDEEKGLVPDRLNREQAWRNGRG